MGERIENKDWAWDSLNFDLNVKDEKSFKNVSDFYEKLKFIVSQARSLRSIEQCYKYNESVNDKLDKHVSQLELVLQELKSTTKSIKKLKGSYFNLNNELKSVKLTDKKKRLETQEMELVTAIYDKDLLRKWHLAKKANNIQTMENFINTLAGKKEALDCVLKLAMNQLSDIRKKSGNNSIESHVMAANALPPPKK